jgi:hypothetical protein
VRGCGGGGELGRGVGLGAARLGQKEKVPAHVKGKHFSFYVNLSFASKFNKTN